MNLTLSSFSGLNLDSLCRSNAVFPNPYYPVMVSVCITLVHEWKELGGTSISTVAILFFILNKLSLS